MIIPETWKIGLAATLACIVICLIGGLAISRANLKAELAQKQAELTICQHANADWVMKADSINATVRKLKEETEMRLHTALQNQQKAQRSASKHDEQARALLSAQSKGNECQAAEKLIRHYLWGHP